MTTNTRIRALAGVATVALLSTATMAQAQTDGAPASAELEELVVTAQKRAQNIQEVPSAISALSGDSLQERGIVDVEDLQFLVPSMQSGRMLGTTAITIRGVGLNVGSPGVAIHVDGVYQPRPSMGDLTQVDLERVEVLRGPQGTLYGRNANGGVVNFVTQAPTGVFEGYVLGSYASYGESRLEGVVNVPFSERVGARLAVHHSNREEGFVENVMPGGQDLEKGRSTSARLRLTADITDNFTADLSLTGLTSSGPTGYYSLMSPPSAAAIATNPFLADAIVPSGPRKTSANDPVTTNREFGQAAVTLAWDLGPAQLKSISSYSRLADRSTVDEDSSNISAFPSTNNVRSKTLSQEVNLAADLGRFEGVVGAYFMRDESEEFYGYVFPLGISFLPPYSELAFQALPRRVTTRAVFGDVTASLSDRARILAGIRFSEDKVSVGQNNYFTFGPGPQVTTCGTRHEATFKSTTPRLGVQYDLSEDSNLYGTVSKGFKSGGFNISGCDESYNPERLTAYELGWKNRFADGAVTFNTTAFYYDYTDLQLSQVVGLSTKISNAAQAEVKGLEFEGLWRATPSLTLNGNVSLLDARFKEFFNTDGLNPDLGLQDVSGNRLRNSPKFSTNIGGTYEPDVDVMGGRLTLRADLSYRSRVYFREFNAPEDSQEAYEIVNASITWTSPNEAYKVRLFGTNLTAQEYIVALNSSDNFGSRYAAWGAPRQIGLELRADF